MASWWDSFRRIAPGANEEAYRRELEKLRAQAPVPAIWLFGKTGSGKSSVIRYLTGATQATIGQGFRPETKTSRRFDFPDALEPLLTFLDTRGLGEAAYDPTQDIASFSETTQLMVVTARVSDQALLSVLEPLRMIRRQTPERPVVLVLTHLHEATGAVDLSAGPDPFSDSAEDRSTNVQDGDDDSLANSGKGQMPAELQTLIAEKKRQFAGLVDAIICVNLTQPDDGFANPNFGGRRLKQAILDKLPQAYRQALLTANQQQLGDGSSTRQDAELHKHVRWQVLASSALAASVAAVPVPWLDIPGVLAIQGHLAVRIAQLHHQELTPAHWAVLSSAAGSRIALRMALRESLKFIPVVGMAAGAASSFAITYALGMSWDWYFADLRRGRAPSAEELKEVFAEQLKRGQELWKAE